MSAPETIRHHGRVVRPGDTITIRDRDRHQVKCLVHRDLHVEIGAQKVALTDFARHGLSVVELQRADEKAVYEVGSDILVKNTKRENSSHPEIRQFNATVDDDFQIRTPWGETWSVSGMDDPYVLSAAIEPVRPVYRYGDSTNYFRVELTETGRVEITVRGIPMLDPHSTLQMGRDLADLSVRAAEADRAEG